MSIEPQAMCNEDQTPDWILGVDAGALYLKVAAWSPKTGAQRAFNRCHQGEPLAEMSHILEELGGLPEGMVTGVHAELIAQHLGWQQTDEVSALITGTKNVSPGASGIMDIGGSSLSLVSLSPDGAFAGYQTNTLCAAGTGSFLDEQAERLGVDLDDRSRLDLCTDPPSIAARCAVFAKSDLIHRQQEGYGIPEMWSGLCRGLAHTIQSTLFKGRTPRGPVVVTGGVARNSEVIYWLEETLPVPICVPDHPEMVVARGVLGLVRGYGAAGHRAAPTEVRGTLRQQLGQVARPPLTLIRSNYPSFQVLEAWDVDGNEIRLSRLPSTATLSGTIGIDVGSTSTKMVWLDPNEEVVLDIYRKTDGDPIKATRRILTTLWDLAQSRGWTLDVQGVGTTGSGRKLVGSVLGADEVVNEITAHVTGALKTDPTIDTIFEIGGQDAKFIRTQNGKLRDSNMNYVCAAGTGSFVEELARKLGVPISEVGSQVMGTCPPVTSDRCTVFMEQDARNYLRKGYSRREVLGAVLYSVVQNYLNRVVGNRPVSRDKVFFQGATARNQGLVAAFENLLQVEVVVSPYCHVMGALGVALLTARAMRDSSRTTTFAGLTRVQESVRLTQDVCTLCQNRCTITTAHVPDVDKAPSWGYLCGREPHELRRGRETEYAPYLARSKWVRGALKAALPGEDCPTVTMPNATLTVSMAPFWTRFFAHLGHRLELSPPTRPDIVELSHDQVGADYCFPIKLAHGHLQWLLRNRPNTPVFVPYVISERTSDKTTQSFFCPYNIGLPAMLHASMEMNGHDTTNLLRATLDFRWDAATAGRRLHQDLGTRIPGSKEQYIEAYALALQQARELGNRIRKGGQQELQAILASGKPAVVIAGRPYNTFDSGANLDLPRKLAHLGLTVVPMDFLPLEEEPIADLFSNMFWAFGRSILEAAHFVARTPNLYMCALSNFGCGPDSFVHSYVESVMGNKPVLFLELDEHSADAGYLTRLEAFRDVIRQHGSSATTQPHHPLHTVKKDAGLDGRTLWIPPMGEPGPIFTAAALRQLGWNARPLPMETVESFNLGKRELHGGECLPCPATLGTFLKTVQDSGLDPSRHALFMPTAQGPCRFGQYATLNRMVLDRRGWTDTPIVSWSSTDSYEGLDTQGRRLVWSALVLGDVLFKIRCATVPYERDPGSTERLYLDWTKRLAHGFESRQDLKKLVRQMRDEFLALPRRPVAPPLVGIVGEIYVRNNPFTNQHVVRRIEQAGGEAWLAPISEWIVYTAWMEDWFASRNGTGVFDKLALKIKNHFLHKDEERWHDAVSPLLDHRREPPIQATLQCGTPFFPLEFEGESIITVGRAVEFARQGAGLVVNCSPFGCMHGCMTAGVFQEVEAQIGIPIANMFYDGEGDLNGILATYLGNLSSATRKEALSTRG